MKELLYGKVFVITVMIEMVVYAIVYTVSLCVLGEKHENDNCNYNEKRSLVDIILGCIKLFSAITWILGGIYLVIKFNVKIIIFIFLILAFLWWISLMVYVIWDFVKYISARSSSYKLTKENKNTLILAGYFVFMVWAELMTDNVDEMIIDVLHKLPIYGQDILKFLILFFWYFSIPFFNITILVLIISDIQIFIKEKIHFKLKMKLKIFRMTEKEYSKVHKAIDVKINELKITQNSHNIKYYFGAVIWSLFRPGVILLEVIMEWLGTIPKLVLIIPIIWMGRGIKKEWRMFNNLKDRIVLLISRLVLVFSVLIILCIDKYMDVFSMAGSDIYEFLCGVILIPFLLAQLDALKGHLQKTLH